MGILNKLVPVYYRRQNMGVQERGGEVVAIYDVQILNAAGGVIGVVHPTSTLTAQEKAAVAAIFLRDKQAFEIETGLTEWEDQTSMMIAEITVEVEGEPDDEPS